MPGSVAALETLILEGRIKLQRSPVLISAMMSAAVEHDSFDNRWFSKRRATNRIDALVVTGGAFVFYFRDAPTLAGELLA